MAREETEDEAIPTPGAAPKKRGRHPKDCVCERCETRRAGGDPGKAPRSAKRAKAPGIRLSSADLPEDVIFAAANMPTSIAGMVAARVSEGRLQVRPPAQLLAFNAKAFRAMLDGLDIELTPTKAYLLGTAATLASGFAIGAISMMAGPEAAKAAQEAAEAVSPHMHTVVDADAEKQSTPDVASHNDVTGNATPGGAESAIA